jgi:hypothetical protein
MVIWVIYAASGFSPWLSWSTAARAVVVGTAIAALIVANSLAKAHRRRSATSRRTER